MPLSTRLPYIHGGEIKPVSTQCEFLFLPVFANASRGHTRGTCPIAVLRPGSARSAPRLAGSFLKFENLARLRARSGHSGRTAHQGDPIDAASFSACRVTRGVA